MCYVRDVAAGIQLLHSAPRLEHRIYNLGNGRVTRNMDLVDAIRRLVPEFQVDLPAGGDADSRYMDLTRVSSEVGYQPRIGMENGLAEYVEWLKTHPY